MRQPQSVATAALERLEPGHSNLDVAGLSLDPDLSQIQFCRRVFDEVCDESNPLLERVKFLGIVGTIIDEFIVTRYARLARSRFDSAGHLKRVEKEVSDLLAEARTYLREQLTPLLAQEGIHLVTCADLQPKERAEVESYFNASVLPLLMPLGCDAARPFPHIAGRTLALAVIVRSAGNEHFACVQVPEAIPALVPFHRCRVGEEGGRGDAALELGFVWRDELVSENLAAAFPGMEIVAAHPFRVSRDAGLDSELPEGLERRDAVAEGLRRREFGDVFSLTVDETSPARLVERLTSNLRVSPAAVHTTSDFTDLAGLAGLARLDRPDLHDPPLVPRSVSRLGDVFAAIREQDILLHHPFESFQPVIDFVASAARDSNVLAISTTLYRAGRNSPIVEALLDARSAGKQVRVVIELRARSDEENNLAWARALRDAGAHVVYGMVGLKVHAKATLVVRREAGHIRRYVHLSSGNYNPATSTVYTDLGLFSCRDSIASDATHLFNVLTGYAAPSEFGTLLVAPLTLRREVKHLIERESSWARSGREAHMILKMNALADDEIVESFYRASQAGVRIDLIVRGICRLRPGVRGISDNIRVRSIVGRFLEHSRAWYFRNGGNEEVYVGSADLMARNLDQRVEVMARLDDVRLKQRVRQEILARYLTDNVKARELTRDGTYVRVGRGGNETAINSQEHLL